MSWQRIVGLVALREVRDRLRSKVFIFGTVLPVLGVVAAIVVPALLAGEGPRDLSLGVAGEVPEGFPAALEGDAAAQEAEIDLVELEDREAAATAVEEGEVDAALVDGRQLLADGAPDQALVSAVDGALQQVDLAARVEAAGLEPEQVEDLLMPREPVPVVDVRADGGAAPVGMQDDPLGWVVALAATVLLFLAIQINASSLLTGAIEEKSSRVIEVLLGSVRPWHLLTAKVLAMTALALGQIGLIVLAALAANAAVDAAELPEATAATVVTSLVMVVLGFVFYAALYTVAGSLASSIEDAQASSGPLGIATTGAYFAVVFAVLPSPRGTLAQVLSYLPPTAPFTVPARVALGAMQGWEVVLAAVVTAVGAAITVRISGRLYASSVLAGGRLTWREAWRAEPIR